MVFLHSPCFYCKLTYNMIKIITIRKTYPPKVKMNNNRLSPFYKNIALWLLIGLVVTMLFNFFNRSQLAKEKAQLSYTKFLELVNEGKVTRVVRPRR